MAQVGGLGPQPLGAAEPVPAGARSSLWDVLARNLEAEQERWFLWLPVMFGAGIALYFLLPVEPWNLAALLPAVAALAVRLALGRGGLGALVTAALLAVALG